MTNSKKTIAKMASSVADTSWIDAQRASGDWNPLWDTLCDWDPEFMERYLAFRNVPHRNGPLPPKYKELILIAINVATTHMYTPGVRRHIRNALQQGASRDEILEVIQLTTVLGIHACNVGIPILAEELKNQPTVQGSQLATVAGKSRRRTKAT
ncbi:carboxymuconolactone decarboxylase family protein [Acidiphilium sp. AL]|uniref:carboxymuconolactone decarboxylase family protein n=1 Tax=Acidiphilium sp. AL TaxID=2871704 RepID=UPI0021CB244A|nr:carboxymuconolactone decarboxylase family protein [Acidiphilium sp. AL]MCU4161941.1 carboxymuconolactone decarboxylase family protein [Acidiphilium sp. AL]